MNLAQRPLNHLLRALPTTEFDALRDRLEIVDLVRDTVLVEAGKPLTRVYLPHSGAISMIVRPSGGHAVEVAMVGRDSVFHAFAVVDDGLSLCDAVVLLPGIASVVDIAMLRSLAERSAMLRNLLARHEQALFAQVQQSAACNACHSVEARLSRWLLRARDLCGSETLLVTQEFLAQLIGVQRNAVSIVAHALQRAGMIRYSRGHIHIKNADGLRETSCECYGVVRAHQQRLLNQAP